MVRLWLGRKLISLVLPWNLMLIIHRMQTAENANGFASIGVNFGMTALCVLPTWIVLSELEGSHEVQETVDEPVNKVVDDSN